MRPRSNLMEVEMDNFAEMEATPASAEDDSESDESPEMRSGSEQEEKSESPNNLPTSLVAGGGAALGSLAVGSILFEAMRVTVLVALATPLLARMKAEGFANPWSNLGLFGGKFRNSLLCFTRRIGSSKRRNSIPSSYSRRTR